VKHITERCHVAESEPADSSWRPWTWLLTQALAITRRRHLDRTQLFALDFSVVCSLPPDVRPLLLPARFALGAKQHCGLLRSLQYRVQVMLKPQRRMARAAG